MADLMQENGLLLIGALIVAILIAVWVLAASRRTRVDLEPPRSEDGIARRNQALIDTPPASAAPSPPVTPPDLAGAGEAVAMAAVLAPASPPSPVPMAEPAAPTPLSTAASTTSELTRIKGLGPKLAEQLRAAGITTLAQIAAWDDAQIDAVDRQLGRFQGRIRRDDWVGQARLLTGGDAAGYEAKFGKL